jgi:hypothetical protein
VRVCKTRCRIDDDIQRRGCLIFEIDWVRLVDVSEPIDWKLDWLPGSRVLGTLETSVCQSLGLEVDPLAMQSIRGP